MRILVTGGAGFIGSEFVRAALKGQYSETPKKLYVLDSLTYSGSLQNLSECEGEFEFIQGDITDESLILKIFENVDYVVNFAAETHVDNSIKSPMPFVHSNFVGTANLLACLVKFPGIRFVQVSTDEVYGSISDGFWDENSRLEPNSPYSATKAAADLLVLSFIKTYGVNASITRCCNNYGPHQFPEKIIPFFIEKILAGQQVPVYGNGMNTREWIHVSDHCRAIWMVLINGVMGSTYNIGSGVEFTNLELTLKLIGLLGKDSESISFVADRPGHDYRYALDFSKIRDELNFKNEIEFNSGLSSTVNWYRNKSI
jgi:dTDP-glucose 4,6-dehydratase